MHAFKIFLLLHNYTSSDSSVSVQDLGSQSYLWTLFKYIAVN